MKKLLPVMFVVFFSGCATANPPVASPAAAPAAVVAPAPEAKKEEVKAVAPKGKKSLKAVKFVGGKPEVKVEPKAEEKKEEPKKEVAPAVPAK